jgi:hypothetical protein
LLPEEVEVHVGITIYKKPPAEDAVAMVVDKC